MIEQLPEWLQIFLLSMVPGVEAKVSVPLLGLYQFGWDWWLAYLVGIAGNMVLVPFGLLFFYKLEKFLRKYKKPQKAMDWIFSRIRKRADKKIKRYEKYALLFFVAIPLPLTGAGLGVVIAYLFNIKFIDSIKMIFIGVIIATSVTTFIYLTWELIPFR